MKMRLKRILMRVCWSRRAYYVDPQQQYGRSHVSLARMQVLHQLLRIALLLLL